MTAIAAAQHQTTFEPDLPQRGRRPHATRALRHLLAGLPLAAAAVLALPGPAGAAEAGLDGAKLHMAWGIPFAGLLLSIALFPLAAGRFWHHHYGKVALAWALVFLVPFALTFGPQKAAQEAIHTALLEYIPFIILLFALFTVSGGILVTGNLKGSPWVNTGLLALGTVLASFIGTTGAAMVLIRPLLRANDGRRYNAHVVVFFIFLVANIGGALTPLGDPPLFLGFLKGVTFFWTTTHMLTDTLLMSGLLLGAFHLLDRYYYAQEKGLPPKHDPTPPTENVGLRGLQNLPLLVGIIGAILMSALWKPGIVFDVYGTHVELQWIVRDVALVAIALVSLAITPAIVRERNGFDFAPIEEVAKLFAAIFLTIIPVIAMLKAGSHGPFAALAGLVTDPHGNPVNVWYFWLTGGLSAFLDNAPTYLVFFNLAGGDPHQLMNARALTLEAISAGAVFMGALTYIGNAPNFMVLSIALHRGVRMPSFFGYMGWAFVFLLPCLVLITVLNFI